MITKVTIALQTAVREKDREQMHSVAAMLTNHTESIRIKTNPEDQKEITVEFGIKKARQADVVDSIGRAFRETITNYNDLTISFTNKKPKIQRKFTPKQGQYLAFIHYYIKIHGIAPAEADLQKYFKVTPPSVHSMLNKLEQNGLIKRIPRQARSIELLISQKEIPDLA